MRDVLSISIFFIHKEAQRQRRWVCPRSLWNYDALPSIPSGSGLQFLYTWLPKSQMSPFLGISLSHIYNQVYYPPSEECSLSSYHLLKFRTPLKAHSITKVPCRIIWSPLATVSAQLFLLHKPVLLSEVWLPWALSLRLCFLIVSSKTVTEVVSGRDSSKTWPAFSPLDYTV